MFCVRLLPPGEGGKIPQSLWAFWVIPGHFGPFLAHFQAMERNLDVFYLIFSIFLVCKDLNDP